LKADAYDVTAVYNLGYAHETTGAWDKAEVQYRKALEIDPKYAVAQTALGRIKLLSGHPDESLPEFQKAIDLYRKMGSKEGEATGYQAICESNISLRHWEEALTYCNKSASIKEAIGDKRGLAASLRSTAYVQQVTGKLADASSSQQKALALSREIGDMGGTARGLTTLGSIQEDQGALREALASRHEALSLYREVGDQADEAELLQSLGSLGLQLGDIEDAEKNLAASAEIYQSLGIEDGTAQVVSDQGLLAFARGDLGKADELLARAITEWRSLESEEGVSETQLRQAMVAVREGRYGTATKLSAQAVADYRKADDKLNTARCLLVQGSALLRTGDLSGAGDAFDAALAAARPLGNPILIADLEAARSETYLAGKNESSAAPLVESLCKRAGEARLPHLDFLCSIARGTASLAAGNAGRAGSLSEEARTQALSSGRSLDVMEAMLLKARAQDAQGDASAAATGLSLIQQAGKSGAHDLVVRGAAAAAPSLAKGTRPDSVVAAAAALQSSIEIIRRDLPSDQLAGFLERGADLPRLRLIVDRLKKDGRGPEAEKLETLLKP